jgi:hypothetical protein
LDAPHTRDALKDAWNNRKDEIKKDKERDKTINRVKSY